LKIEELKIEDYGLKIEKLFVPLRLV